VGGRRYRCDVAWTRTAAQVPLTLRRWTRVEYERLVELGVFAGEPIELIGGQLLVAEPQYPYHASGINRVDYVIRAILPPGWIVRTQSPVSLDDESEPEPDLIVVPGQPGDYSDSHPGPPALVMEVAESSLAFDRRDKGSLYARSGVRDYWIVNLIDRVLEVCRDPAPDRAAVYGWRYRSIAALAPPAVVVPLAFPLARLDVTDLLPPRPPRR
jgi:Uma2 family endonuclease